MCVNTHSHIVSIAAHAFLFDSLLVAQTAFAKGCIGQ